MEKRDIIVIVIAIFIVLIMAMYIKPLVTGKEVKLIPDELTGIFQGGNQSLTGNNTSYENATPKIARKLPSVTSVYPDNITQNDITSSVTIRGKNLTESMNITFSKDQANVTFPTVFENGTLYAKNVSLPEGNWTIKIHDPTGKGITYNTTRLLSVVAAVTPVPTWDGNPIPLKTTEKPAGKTFQTRPYPEDIIVNKTPMKTFSNFSGVSSVSTAPVHIPYGYWDLVYTVNFQTNIANPKDTGDNVFEFNKQFKEPLVTYEGEPIVFYPNNGSIPEMIPVKEEVESETVFKPSKDTILIKKAAEDSSDNLPETSTQTYSGQALVETVGYTRPDITIRIKNNDTPDVPEIIVKPDGGIDPLQWDEAKHKEEAEKILKQKGEEDLLDSALYKNEWEDSWARVKDPRPWTERIYGPGNYSFSIDTQSLDSYNIQIKVPESVNQTTFNESDGEYSIQKGNIAKLLHDFSRDYNSRIGSEYFSNLSQYLSSELTTSEKLNPIYRELSQSRASGCIIQNVVIDDILIRGDTATARGELSVNCTGYYKSVPYDIELFRENTGWKFKMIPVIR